MKTHRSLLSLSRRIALLTMVCGLTFPSISSAHDQLDGVSEAEALPAGDDDDDPPCGQAVIALEVDVDTGDVYIVNGLTGALQLTDNELNIHFGTMTSVLIDIEYSRLDWEVTVLADQDPPVVSYTRGGTFRYKINANHDEYIFTSDLIDSGTEEAPVPPWIILKPDGDCPPET